ncbi:MAG: radical SAM protein [Myxococcota bacterium]
MNVAPFYLPGSYLVLELANGCNLKCRHCAQADVSHPHYQETGYFPRAGVQALLADCARHGIQFDNLVLFWLGEPLLHPEFNAIYEDVLAHTGPSGIFKQVEVHTNASMLTRQMAARLLNRRAVPQRWHLTLDAADAGTYLEIKGVELLARVEENVERLILWKGRGGFAGPQLVLQYIVSDRNEAEVDAFIARWKPVFERARLPLELTAFHVPHTFEKSYLFFKSLDCPTPEEQARQNTVFQRVVKRLGLSAPLASGDADVHTEQKLEAPVERLAQRLETPCSGFWKSPVIGWNGMLTTCTRDSLGENQLGNVLQTPFSTLWFGEGRIARWRQHVGAGDYGDLTLCQSCFIPRSINYTGISAGEIAHAAAQAAIHTHTETLLHPSASPLVSPSEGEGHAPHILAV